MRVGPLSDDKIIDLLSKYFVPVWLSNDHFALAGPSNRRDKDEMLRIYKERESRRHLNTGTTVCVVILALGRLPKLTTLKPAQGARTWRSLAPSCKKSWTTGRSARAAPKRSGRRRLRLGASPARPQTEGGQNLHILTRSSRT